MESQKEIKTFEYSNSADTLKLAADLGKFIKENRLYQNIQGKEYVNIEGWQYAGSRLGLAPIVKKVINISTEGELKYSASVIIKDLKTKEIVGSGFAICSNKEQGKKFYQEFAISSMAQTRAIGKAYRNLLAWTIRAAGYEATPAEEMDYIGNAPEDKPGTQQLKAGEVVLTNMPESVNNTKSEMPDMEGHNLMTEKANEIKLKEQNEQAAQNTANAVKYASAKQKEEIIRLLNNPVITRQEKTKMLLNINKLDEERATQAIAKLRKVIEEREEQTASA